MEPRQGDAVSASQQADRVAVRGTALADCRPLASLRALPVPQFAWGAADGTIVGGGTAETVTADGPDRFAAITERGAALLAGVETPEALPHEARPRLFGGFGFHADAPDGDGPWAGYDAAAFTLPAVQVTATPESVWLTTLATGPDAGERAEDRLATWAERLGSVGDLPAAPPPGIAAERPTPDRAAWARQVRDAVAQIRQGTLRKVVLAQALQVDLAGELDVPAALSRLAAADPDCTQFLFSPADAATFFGATPELLVERSGRSVRTAALAGSTGRGDTEAEDEWLAESLRESEKDGHEHDLVVEAIRGQLEPLAASVHTGSRRVRRLATVQHLETPIRATLDSDTHVLSLVEALHPTPAVGGLPPDAALETIRTTETFERGWYAAPVGWFDAAGNGRFVVALRSALASGDAARLFAGDGIVRDSDPDREWDELQLKYRPILDQLA